MGLKWVRLIATPVSDGLPTYASTCDAKPIPDSCHVTGERDALRLVTGRNRRKHVKAVPTMVAFSYSSDLVRRPISILD